MARWTSRDVLRHRWDKTWKIWESVSQAGSASSPCKFVLLLFSYLSLFWCQPTVLFIFTVLGCASVCSFRFPSLLGHHRSLSGVLCAEQWVLINYVLCTVVYLHQSYPLGYFLTSFLSCFWYYLGKSLGRKSGRHTKPYQIRGACHVFDKILFGSFWYIALTHLESLQY